MIRIAKIEFSVTSIKAIMLAMNVILRVQLSFSFPLLNMEVELELSTSLKLCSVQVQCLECNSSYLISLWQKMYQVMLRHGSLLLVLNVAGKC